MWNHLSGSKVSRDVNLRKTRLLWFFFFPLLPQSLAGWTKVLSTPPLSLGSLKENRSFPSSPLTKTWSFKMSSSILHKCFFYHIFWSVWLVFPQRDVAIIHTTPICFQVEQPIITQGSSVTKITFEGRQPPTVTKISGGSSVPKLTSPVTSIPPIQASEKTAVSDILQMSLMEAQIDTNVEHMVVDPPKKALATSVLAGEAGALPSTHMVVAGMAKCRESCSSPSAVGPSLTTRKLEAAGVPATGQFMRIQNVGQKKAEESPTEIIIQVRPGRKTDALGRWEVVGLIHFGVSPD